MLNIQNGRFVKLVVKDNLDLVQTFSVVVVLAILIGMLCITHICTGGFTHIDFFAVIDQVNDRPVGAMIYCRDLLLCSWKWIIPDYQGRLWHIRIRYTFWRYPLPFPQGIWLRLPLTFLSQLWERLIHICGRAEVHR